MFSGASWLALLGLFFASGASGLIYEIVWMRLLSLTMSVTVYAVTTVLCAFMAGLALGAAIAGRFAHRARRPLLAYGCVEIALAAVALITPTLLFHLGPIYASVHAALGGGGFGFAVARFVLAFAVLLVPSTLMGTTLPLLSRAVIQNTEVVGRGAGALYAVNTLGAVVGCVAAGFVLIPNLGLSLTNGFAASVSLAVGLCAVWLGRDLITSTDHVAARLEPASSTVRLAYAAIAISGFTALGYQVLWTRGLEQFTHNSTYAYSAILATFLLGIAAGSAVAARVVDRLRRPLLGLGVIELVISASVLCAMLVYANLDRITVGIVTTLGGLGSWGKVVAVIFVQSSLVLLATTFLFGMTFPFVARVVVESLDSVGERIATAYTANTAGSIFGSVVIGFVVLPVLGMQGTFFALAALNAAVGLALAWRAVEGRGRIVAVAAAAALAVIAVAVVPHQMFERTFVRRFGPLPFYREEITDTIMVTDDAKRGRMIRYGDGRGTAGTGTVKEDRMYAEIPLLLHEKPLRILNICFGVGNSLSSLTMHPVERIDSVELSPGVLAAAPFFASTNRDVLADPRIHMTIADGRNFLLLSRDKYDIIRLDPPELHTAGIVNLYTKEFYELARDHLAPGGIFSIWVNMVMTPEEDLKHLVRTVASVFPYVSVWHGPLFYSWVINGSMTPHDPDLARLMKKYEDPKVRAEMESIGVGDPFAFLSHFVFSGDEARAWAGDGPLVTDDKTRLDFTVPRSLDSSYGFANANTDSWMADQMEQNLAVKTFFRKIQQMMAYKKPVLPHLTSVEKAGFTPEQVKERMAAQAEAAAGKPVTTTPTGPGEAAPSARAASG
ncbi:fused MFS/spermidine synthase, partial [Candidatus Binatia bacterium]|nr:fused MFS/spermidine synthase [Candidatus Binatia bacterium]